MDYSVIVIALKVVLISFHKSQNNNSLIRIIKLSFRRECLAVLHIGSKGNWCTSYLCIHLSWSWYNNPKGNQHYNVWVERYIMNLILEDTCTFSFQIQSHVESTTYNYFLFSYLKILGWGCRSSWLRKGVIKCRL